MIKDYCVMFDMDGVIFDSERACLDTWTEAAASIIEEPEWVQKIYEFRTKGNWHAKRGIVQGVYFFCK